MSIPNILTCIRLALMPVFLTVYFSPLPNAKYIAMGILCASFVTDVLDGFIARRFNMITTLGKVLDPIADKLMQIAVLICIAFSELYLACIVIFLLVKDALMGIGAIVLYKTKKKIISANWFGKVSCFLSVACSLILIFGDLIALPDVLKYICAGIIFAANMVAFISYLMAYLSAQKA